MSRKDVILSEARDLGPNHEIPRLASSPQDDRPACPFCQADTCELISLFGSQLLLSQYRCKRCGSYFEAIRENPLPLGEGRVRENNGS